MFKSLELQLIAQVRKYEDLYDRRFRDFELKDRLWQKVGDVLGISAVSAKYRWGTLKNRYFRLRKKPNPSNEWQFYNHLRFLDAVYPIQLNIKEVVRRPKKKSAILIESHLEEIPRHIQKSISNSEPVINNANDCSNGSKSSSQEICDYEFKASNDDRCTYGLKTNNAGTAYFGLDVQNRLYEIKKISNARKTYGKQDKDDCESFAQFVAAKLRSLQSDAERDAMKQRVQQAIEYSPGSDDDGILDIVFIEGDETED